jgi:16S rRNA (uracil1498-N3)-methyltransferase
VRRRFFVERFDGDRARIEGEKAHHLERVLRAQAGQVYELSDGGHVRLGRIENVGRDRVEFTLLEEIPAFEPLLHVTLLLSVVKFDAFEWAIEKATELGVSEIMPLAAARSEKSLLAAAERRAERWHKILLEAAQQSRRLRPPQLRAVTSVGQAFAECKNQFALFLSERPEAPLLRVNLKNVRTRSAALAIGPEGGWTEAEVELAQKAGLREASLGRLILRTETAVIAALASLSYALGEE